MNKVLGMVLCFLGFSCVNTFAQNSNPTPKPVHTKEKAQAATPVVLDATLTTIFSNLGSGTRAYNDTDGFLVAGTPSGLGQEFIGLAFTPKADATVTEIHAALQFLDEGTGAPNQVDLSLYTDSNGVPGTLIDGPHTIKNLPLAGTCCALATWHLSKGVSVFAKTQYWVVADTPTTGTGSDSAALWYVIFPTFPEALNSGTWFPFNGNSRFAAAVLGTEP
jgi:hypothetical protein